MRINLLRADARDAEPANLAASPTGFALAPGNGAADADALYLSPPWIDSHCHIFYGTTSFGIKPDAIGLQTGVHLLVDAGSAGTETLRAFTEYIVPEAKTRIMAFLNVGPTGLVTLREYRDMSAVNPETTAEAIQANRALWCGVKVRSSGIIVEDKGTAPFHKALLAAALVNCPIMVHMGENPPDNDENLPLFRPGDILTHCFHGKYKPLWNPDGTPVPEMEKAIARGVQLDVGHGAASFDARIAAPVLARGFYDFSISTDLHGRNVHGPVYTLAATMTKFLALGMPLDAVIRSVTDIPARRLGLGGWCDDPARNGTVFRVRPVRESDPTYTDSVCHPIDVQRVIDPVAVIVDGQWQSIDPDVAPPM